MKTLSICFDGVVAEYTAKDINKILLYEALSIAQNKELRTDRVEIANALNSALTRLYRGHAEALCIKKKEEIKGQNLSERRISRILKEISFIPADVFSEALKMKDKLLDILLKHCNKHGTVRESYWEDGWECEVVPQIMELSKY